MSNEEPVQDGNTRNEREKATNRNSLPPTRREISFHLSSQLCVWLASFSPPLLFPRAGIVLSSTRIPKERSALVRDPDRSFWRENRCNTRKRFGQFNPLKRMARRSIEERKLEQGRGNGQHLFRNHPLPPPPLFFPLSPILPTFFYHPPLSFFTREGEFLFSFPTIKPNAKDPFLLDVCNTLLPPSRSRIVFRNERNFPFVEESNIRVDRFFFQQFEILKRNKYRNWDWI